MKAMLVGYGRMSRLIEQTLMRNPGNEIVGIVDVGLFESPFDVPGEVDVVIDFSHPSALDVLVRYARERHIPLLVGTTGHSERQLESLRAAAADAPILLASNYSLGVAVLRKAVELVAPMLKDSFDVEIVETHHNQKADAPSGTAKTLLDAVDPRGEFKHVFGREGQTGKRGREIGVHAVRGGSVAGEHRVYFYGEDEVLELRHSATSRQIFVNGAVKAAYFLCGKQPGLYTVDDVLNRP